MDGIQAESLKYIIIYIIHSCFRNGLNNSYRRSMIWILLLKKYVSVLLFFFFMKLHLFDATLTIFFLMGFKKKWDLLRSDIEGFRHVWCFTVEMPCAGRKCSPTGRLLHLQELYGREGGFQDNIYSGLFLSLAGGPWEKTGEDKQWTIEFRDEQWYQLSMCHHGMWIT